MEQLKLQIESVESNPTNRSFTPQTPRPLFNKKEYMKSYNKAYKQIPINKTKACLREKKYREKHHDRYSVRGKKYSQTHSEQRKQYKKTHTNDIKKSWKNYYKNHKTEILLRGKEYLKQHRQQFNEYSFNRRSLKNMVNHNKINFNEISLKTNNHCLYCNKDLLSVEKKQKHIDHYYPLNLIKKSKNDIQKIQYLKIISDKNNLWLSCQHCNSSKSNKLPLNFVWDNI
jgi:hypothetical protein